MEPRFNEEEGARILARAVELQHQSAQAATVSLADLESAAVEAGIDPCFVHQAAFEATQPNAPIREPSSLSPQEAYWKIAFASALLQVVGILSLSQINPGIESSLCLLITPVLLGVATARRNAFRSVSFAVWTGSSLFGTLLLWAVGAFFIHAHRIGGDGVIAILTMQTIGLLVAWLIGSMVQGLLRIGETAKRPSRI